MTVREAAILAAAFVAAGAAFEVGVAYEGRVTFTELLQPVAFESDGLRVVEFQPRS